MKTIGMLGGMSWESSIEYYRMINETVRDKLGGLHSAKCLMYSVDFDEIEILQQQGRWDDATQFMVDAAQRVERGGADFLIICTNTMHLMADNVQANIDIPLLHIADATAEKIRSQGLQKIGLLGTKYTMEGDFYRGRLGKKHGLTVLLPNETDRQIVHDVIYNELVIGKILSESKSQFRRIIAHLVTRGAEGIILGCTEIGLLVKAADSSVPTFDTARIHAIAAVEYALT
jgi:aspartate racemase